MKKILVIGAGLSASTLIKYLLDHSRQFGWKIRLADKDIDIAAKKISGHPNGEALRFDVFHRQQCRAEVAGSDIVVSLLPATMHALVATDCVELGKPMVTASYVSDAIKALDSEA
jgi:saccharopine dehydrogenase-like NADP-dependent oxidoreductase